MTKQEVTQMLTILKTAYPRFYVDMTKEEAYSTIDLWTTMFANDDALLVVTTVKEMINSFKYPPTVADIKEKMYSITDIEKKQPMEYWKELDKIVQNGIYGAVEGFNNASEPVKRFLCNPAQIKELAQMDKNTFNTVTKGQFLKQIENILAEEKENKMMLPETKTLIQNIAKSLSIDYNSKLQIENKGE